MQNVLCYYPEEIRWPEEFRRGEENRVGILSKEFPHHKRNSIHP